MSILGYLEHVTASDRCLSLGFKGARDRCFPRISKETFYWLFALIIFRILLDSNSHYLGEKQSKVDKFECILLS